MRMADPEKDYRPRLAGSTHLDDDSSSGEAVPDPLALPSVVPPLQDVVQGKTLAENVAPNGGLQAWLQVLGSFFLFFNSW